jgi:hypothetical protein
MEAGRGRLLALFHPLLPRRAYRTRTEGALEVGTQLEQAGHCPAAHYAFDHGRLPLERTRCIEGAGKHWVSALASSRHSQWQGQWQRVEAGAAALRHGPPESCRPVRGRCRHGDTTQ